MKNKIFFLALTLIPEFGITQTLPLRIEAFSDSNFIIHNTRGQQTHPIYFLNSSEDVVLNIQFQDGDFFAIDAPREQLFHKEGIYKFSVSFRPGAKDVSVTDTLIITQVNNPALMLKIPFSGNKLNNESREAQLYPNPVQNYLYLTDIRSLDGEVFSVHDISGKLMFKGVYHEKIDVSFLIPGIYLLSTDTPTKSIQLRFVKE